MEAGPLDRDVDRPDSVDGIGARRRATGEQQRDGEARRGPGEANHRDQTAILPVRRLRTAAARVRATRAAVSHHPHEAWPGSATGDRPTPRPASTGEGLPRPDGSMARS